MYVNDCYFCKTKFAQMSKLNFPIPANEKQRLEILKQYNILDTLPEKQFDDLTKLASIICETPITLISLIDKDRQWFKSKIGLDVAETEREASFCQYAIMDDQIFEVENSLLDERFVNNPLVTGDPNIRFYAGAPLKTKDGFNIGTLCAIDTKPKKLTDSQKLALQILANEVVANLELRKERNIIESEKRMAIDSNQLLNAFLENSPSIITIKDIHGSYLYANSSALAAFGKSAEDVLGRNAFSIFSKEIAEKILDDDLDIIRQRHTVINEYTLVEGVREKHFVRHMFPLINNKNLVYGVGSISNDVTESKRLEKEIKLSNDRFTSLFYNSPISIIITDAYTSEFIMVNNTFLQTFGYTQEEIIGKKVDDIKLIVDENELLLLSKDLQKNGKVKDREFKVLKKNGEEFISLSSVEIVQVDSKRQVVSAFQDITALKKIESELILAKKVAEEATAAKSLFLANMSHEIRTPLNAMLGFTELMVKTTLDTQQKDYLNAIDSSGKNLLGTINDILDFSKIEAGRLNIERIPFSPQQALHSVYTMFFSKAQSKDLKLFTSIDPRVPSLVIGDPTRFNQIVINLIGNAIKFTSKGSITVDCSVLEINTVKTKLKIAVKDTGVGIAEANLKKIFDRFEQAEDNTTRNFGGTGLGLSIVKKLVELQNGEIYASSKLNEGSEFVFIIEFEISNSMEYAHTESIAPAMNLLYKGKKVLIVEDNPLNQKLACAVLTGKGFEADVAENGQIALDKLINNSFDIILMDIQMPVLDGYDAAKKIRKELKLTTPIIAMTANALSGEREKCIASGMNDYITKPFKTESLLGLISKYIDQGNLAIKKSLSLESKKGKVTDISFLREFANGKETFVKEMIQIFLEQNPNDIKILNEALKENNFNIIRATTHSLQTSLGFIGFPKEAMNELKLIEQLAIKNEDMNLITEKLQSIITKCSQAQQELKEFL